MSSSINGLNVPSFRALSQQFVTNSKKRALERQDVQPTQAGPTTAPTVKQRNLTRAQRDLEITLRGVSREANNLIESAGSNTNVTDRVNHLTSEFEKAMNGRYDAFVEGGASSYIDFAEQTVAARWEFRAQLRDLGRGVGEPQRPADSVDVRSDRHDTQTRELDGEPRHGGPLNGSRGTDRAQRDIDALVRGLDREAERFGRSFGNNAEAMEKFTTMRDGFMDSVKKEFGSLSDGTTPTYMDFAQKVASMRQAFSRDVRSTFADLEPTRRGNRDHDNRGEGKITGVAGEKAVATDILPRPTETTGTTTPGAPEVKPQGATAADQPTVTGTTEPATPNGRNIDRATRDFDILMRGINRDSKRLAAALGQSSEAEQVTARADAFRTQLEERFKKFMDDGGSDYMGFAGEMATARMSVTRFYAQVAGPKLDRLG